jgi:hypothetical protein
VTGPGRGDGSFGGPCPRLPGDRGGRSDPPLRSTIGRPRVLTGLQIRRILLAYDRFLAWKALRRTVKSQRQLAAEFGVSPATVALAIRSRGDYKQAPPERRPAEIKRRRRVFARLRARGLL